MKTLYCINCGTVRMGEIDTTNSEKDAMLCSKRVCQACGCPYVRELTAKHIPIGEQK
jgi:hypothetical protein